MSLRKKQKKVSVQEYIETYCQEKRIRGRYAVYISPKAHCNLRKIVQLFNGEYHTTTSSLADSIITRHIETYSELLDDVHQKDNREFLEWLKRKIQSDNDSQEPESYDEEE